jgi:hypothetical protein
MTCDNSATTCGRTRHFFITFQGSACGRDGKLERFCHEQQCKNSVRTGCGGFGRLDRVDVFERWTSFPADDNDNNAGSNTSTST